MNNFNLIAKLNPNFILKNLPVAIIISDFQGNILWVNENTSAMFEMPKTVLKRQTLDELIINGFECVKSSVSKGAPVATAVVTQSEREFFVEVSATEQGDNYFIIINDTTAITNFLSVAEKSGKLNKDKNQMIYKLTNEFKSPMQSIQGFSKALLDGLGGELTEKQAKYAKIISKNAVDYLYFLDKFIEFSQTETMCVPLNMQIFDVVNLVQNIIKTNERLFSIKNIKVNFDAEELSKRTIYSDESLLKIVVQNIIEASVKLTDLGLVDIKLSHPDLVEVRKYGIELLEGQTETSFLKISVVDTGIGYTESDLEDLFEPYVHINRSNRKNLVRTFGLGAVQNSVKALNGALDIRSEVMQGCSITIILPIEKG